VQGVVTKRHILRNPWVVIRHFGMGVFVEVLKAPKNATFLEIVARHDFKKRRGEELKQVHALDRQAKMLQTTALKLARFDAVALVSFEQLLAVESRAHLLNHQHAPAKPGESDPLLSRFRVLLSALVAQDGPLRAAIGTLSPNELLAVETRVLKSTQKRLKDEFEQTMQHATTQIEVARAHLGRLFRELAEPEQSSVRTKMSERAQQALDAA
jgi:hypothetical protein